MIDKIVRVLHSHWIYLPVQVLVILPLVSASVGSGALRANSHELQMEIGIATVMSWSVSAALAAFLESSRNSSGALSVDRLSSRPQWVVVFKRVYKQSVINSLGVLLAASLCGIWCLSWAGMDAGFRLAVLLVAAKAATAPCVGLASAALLGRFVAPLVAGLVPLIGGMAVSAAQPRIGSVAGFLHVIVPDASRQLSPQQLVCLISIWFAIAVGFILAAASHRHKINAGDGLPGASGITLGAAIVSGAVGASFLAPASSHLMEHEQVCRRVSGSDKLAVCTWPGHDGLGTQLVHGMAALNRALPEDLRITGQIVEGTGVNYSQRLPEQDGEWFNAPHRKRYLWLNGISPNSTSVASALVRALDVDASEKCGSIPHARTDRLSPQVDFELQVRAILVDGMESQSRGPATEIKRRESSGTSASQDWFRQTALALSRCEPAPGRDPVR